MEFLNKCTGVCRADWQDRGSGEVGRGHQGSHDDDGEGESCLNETRNSHMTLMRIANTNMLHM